MKSRSSFVCQQCGYESPQWYGKCPSCGTWSSLVETVKQGMGDKKHATSRITNNKPVKLSDVKHIEKNRLKSGFNEFDRVMGGGIVPGSVTLLSGDPGIGKSTILLHVIASVGGIYISGEESAEQVKLRAKRLGINGENIYILAETNAEAIAAAITTADEKSGGTLPKLVVVDSIQTLFSEELDGMAGSVGQVRRSSELLVQAAKASHVPVVIIGHVTKEGTIAGPKVLEHMVDTVLYLEGERFADGRILRTLKNRFGAVEEVGIFRMAQEGLIEVANPSELFLQDRVKNVSGSVVTVMMEGTRPILVEIQALVVPTQLAIPRRIGNGIDYNRLQLLVAILQKRLNAPLGGFDIFVNVSGGIKISEPSADLAIALSILSSFKNKPFADDTAAFGELGLMGEIRAVSSEDRRISEAKRIGFVHAVSNKTHRTLAVAARLLS